MPGSSRFIILGTAGHIDHGKTALVRLLTGTDTDRLPEEKSRGISIDLGFAHLTLPGGESCGVVDVPGHERFVKNMLAGACGVDAMMLVIAADEGVMPQTREHLDILDLLGVKRGLVALTKIDLVDEEWLALVTESVREYLAARGFGDFPIVPVSARTGAGRDEVLATLTRAVADLDERPSASAARLPVDRAFTVEGFGTVVTGTLWRGTLHAGDRVVVEPGAVETRIRNLEVHGASVPEARAGQRTAVALAGVPRDVTPRGVWLLAPGTLAPSHMLDVKVRVLPDAAKPLVHRQRVRFHLGASEIIGRIALLEGETLAPGKSAFAQIRLEAPAVADRGDRFVLRSYSPARALAGGTVLIPVAEKRRPGDAASIEALRREESGSPAERLLAALDAMPHGGSAPEAGRKAGLAPSELDPVLESLRASGRLVDAGEGLVLSAKGLRALAAQAEEVLAGLQDANPLRWGVGRGELKSRLAAKLPAAVFEAVLRELGSRGGVSLRGDRVRLGGAEAALPPDLKTRVEAVAGALEAGGKSPPSPKELEESLGFTPTDILDHLTFEGRVAKVSPEFYLSTRHFEDLLAWVNGQFAAGNELSVTDLRAAWGMSRKYSVPFFEHLDREGWTRRVGDVRVRGRKSRVNPPSDAE